MANTPHTFQYPKVTPVSCGPAVSDPKAPAPQKTAGVTNASAATNAQR